jgi:hypothetical protein
MNKRGKLRRKPSEPLDVAKVMEDFQKAEDSPSHRNGTFKIDKPFEEALDTILQAKPESKASKKHQP